MCNYYRFGGVARDLPEGILKRIEGLVFERLTRKIDELELYLTNNEIVRHRSEGVGVLTPEQAIAFSTTGPVLRASGVPYDLRRADPYGIYDRFDFDVAVRYHGDVYDRYLLRLDEIRQSIRILKQAVKQIPEGPIQEGKRGGESRGIERIVIHMARLPQFGARMDLSVDGAHLGTGRVVAFGQIGVEFELVARKHVVALIKTFDRGQIGRSLLGRKEF